MYRQQQQQEERDKLLCEAKSTSNSSSSSSCCGLTNETKASPPAEFGYSPILSAAAVAAAAVAVVAAVAAETLPRPEIVQGLHVCSKIYTAAAAAAAAAGLCGRHAWASGGQMLRAASVALAAAFAGV